MSLHPGYIIEYPIYYTINIVLLIFFIVQNVRVGQWRRWPLMNKNRAGVTIEIGTLKYAYLRIGFCILLVNLIRGIDQHHVIWPHHQLLVIIIDLADVNSAALVYLLGGATCILTIRSVYSIMNHTDTTPRFDLIVKCICGATFIILNVAEALRHALDRDDMRSITQFWLSTCSILIETAFFTGSYKLAAVIKQYQFLPTPTTSQPTSARGKGSIMDKSPSMKPRSTQPISPSLSSQHIQTKPSPSLPVRQIQPDTTTAPHDIVVTIMPIEVPSRDPKTSSASAVEHRATGDHEMDDMDEAATHQYRHTPSTPNFQPRSTPIIPPLDRTSIISHQSLCSHTSEVRGPELQHKLRRLYLFQILILALAIAACVTQAMQAVQRIRSHHTVMQSHPAPENLQINPLAYLTFIACAIGLWHAYLPRFHHKEKEKWLARQEAKAKEERAREFQERRRTKGSACHIKRMIMNERGGDATQPNKETPITSTTTTPQDQPQNMGNGPSPSPSPFITPMSRSRLLPQMAIADVIKEDEQEEVLHAARLSIQAEKTIVQVQPETEDQTSISRTRLSVDVDVEMASTLSMSASASAPAPTSHLSHELPLPFHPSTPTSAALCDVG